MKTDSINVGEIRPSQLMFTYGIGAIVDLPRLSVIVTGLEDWPTNPEYARRITEERLLTAVRYKYRDVQELIAPPIVREAGLTFNPFSKPAQLGAPVAVFPRWLVCPACQLLAPIKSGLFKLKPNFYAPDRTAYIHESCNKAKAPEAIPARFLVACEKGHLDDFPWIEFVHVRNGSCLSPQLRLIEYGPSGEARELEVKCDTCGERRRLAEAFGEDNRSTMPRCRGRRPHLRDYERDGCKNQVRTIILGASNTWFPVVLSTIAIPTKSNRLAQLVEDKWATLQNVTSLEVLLAFRNAGLLGIEISQHPDKDIWAEIQAHEKGASSFPETSPDLRAPEWQVFTQYNPDLNTDDFRIRPTPTLPKRYHDTLQKVLYVERLREVQAMIGFTRLDALGELTDPDLNIQIDPAPISRGSPTWVPATEVHGEGIFIQFQEQRLFDWLKRVELREREAEFILAHENWRRSHGIEPASAGFPGMRYIFLHSFSHALMRQLALECGYNAASISERIYARSADMPDGPMAGILLYTSAPDSEGTLGGLVRLAEASILERLINQALEDMRLCASDPLCAEHSPGQSAQTLHASACHACLFAPETSCERGNKYLDRSLLVPTVQYEALAFFK